MGKHHENYRRGVEKTCQVKARCPICGQDHLVRLNRNEVESHIVQRVYCPDCAWRRNENGYIPEARITFMGQASRRPER